LFPFDGLPLEPAEWERGEEIMWAFRCFNLG